MSTALFLPLFAAVFFGGTIVAWKGIRGLFPGGILHDVREALFAVNRRLHQTGTDRGILRFPGIALAESQKPWIIGQTVGLALIAASFAHFRTVPDRLLAVPASCAAGLATTYLMLGAESRRMLGLVRDELPAAAHLLSLLLEAGQGPYAGLQELINALPDKPLRRQLQALFQARALGVSPAETFEHTRRKVPLDDYHVFLNLIRQGEQLGVGLSRGLRDLSERMIEKQTHAAETAAQKAAVKMLFPLIFFIFPAVFLVVLSPVILRLGEMFGGEPW